MCVLGADQTISNAREGGVFGILFDVYDIIVAVAGARRRVSNNGSSRIESIVCSSSHGTGKAR